MATVKPLSRGQQLLLQRLMAAHILTDDQARDLFQELSTDMDETFPSLERCFGSINQQLTKGFGLEIMDAAPTAAASGSASRTVKKEKFHAVINVHDDEVAKQAFGSHINAHERALIRLIVEKLVDEGHPTDRKTLINLRLELEEPYKLTLAQSEHCVELLLDEQWLVVAPADDNNGTGSGRRRESLQAKLQLGPRMYLELSHLLMSLGMGQDELPQFIFHRN
jgi:Nse1 non-SMC component of SMC5-6 complex